MSSYDSYLNLSFAPENGERGLLDVFVPKKRRKVRAVIQLMHGGGFIGGTKEAFALLASDLAKDGFVVVCNNYRLYEPDTRKGMYPSQVEDCWRALTMVRRTLPLVGVEANRLPTIVSGHSAGAIIAAILASHPEYYEKPEGGRVLGAICFAGAYDLQRLAGNAPPEIRTLVELVFGDLQEMASAVRFAATPVSFWIVHGDKDQVIPYEQAEIGYNTFHAVGQNDKLLRLPRATHHIDRPTMFKAFESFSKANSL